MMIKRELKINLKTFLVWGLSISALLTLIFCIYPTISNNVEIDKLLKALPEEVLKGFNFDAVSISTVFGWYASEGFMIATLIGALYAASLGSTIILKEESDKTIEFLYAKPVSRNKILGSKIIVAIFYICLFNLLLMLVTGIGFALTDELPVTKWLLLTISPIFIQLALFFITAFIATFFTKTRKAMGISFGLVMGTYVINMIAQMSDKVNFLKFFTPFGYIDASTIIKTEALDSYSIIIGVIILIFASLLFIRYNKKELA